MTTPGKKMFECVEAIYFAKNLDRPGPNGIYNQKETDIGLASLIARLR
jgi:hypothetical protein